jgi:hypothetical protein
MTDDVLFPAESAGMTDDVLSSAESAGMTDDVLFPAESANLTAGANGCSSAHCGSCLNSDGSWGRHCWLRHRSCRPAGDDSPGSPADSFS